MHTAKVVATMCSVYCSSQASPCAVGLLSTCAIHLRRTAPVLPTGCLVQAQWTSSVHLSCCSERPLKGCPDTVTARRLRGVRPATHLLVVHTLATTMGLSAA